MDEQETNGNLIEVNRYSVPKGCIPAWVIDESKKNEMILKRAGLNHSPSNHARIVRSMSSEELVVNLGHVNQARCTGDDRFHRVILSTGCDYFVNHHAGKPVYMTLDQGAVFRLQHIVPVPDGVLEWYFKRVGTPRYMVTGQAFMIMPFSLPDLNVFYREHIKEFLWRELQVSVVRADSTFDNDTITDTIRTQIAESEFIIADATLANKNVFYEIGYAEAIGKEIILLQEESETKEPIFFDRAHRRAIMYKTSEEESFRHQLLETVKSIRTRIARVE